MSYDHNYVFILKVVVLAAVLGCWLAAPAYGEQRLARDSTGDNLLCTSCHASVNRILQHRRIKTENIAQAACLVCHEPHAAVQASANKLRRPARGSCVSCHYQYSSAVESGDAGEARVFHEPVKECTNCHQQHEAGQKPELIAPAENLCLNCHVEAATKLSLKHQHQPFASRQCASCHDPHFATQPGLLLLAPAQLCESCHINREGAMDMATQHLPYEQGKCTACHDPHASDYAQLLVAAPAKLCFNCHVAVASKLHKAVVHQPFSERKCLSCHYPHASATASLVKGSTPRQLCYGCHAELEQEFKQKSHHPVGEQLECTSCHEPHGGDYRKLQVIEGNELCFSCHQGKKSYYKNIQHSTMRGNTFAGACLNCHRPHGNNGPSLLIAGEMELCTSCHPTMQFGSGFTHPVGSDYIDPGKGGMLTCMSTCHDPHGTGNQYNITKQNDALCLTCHTDKMAK